MRLEFGGARQRVVGVAFGLLGLTLCDRHPCARGQRPHHDPSRRCRDRLVGPAPSGDQIPARQRGLRNDGAQVRRIPRRETPVLPGRRGRVPRRPNIAGGQGRVSQREITNARDEPAKLGGGLEAGLGRGAGRVRLTLPRQRGALVREAHRRRIPSWAALASAATARNCATAPARSPWYALRQTQAHAAVARAELVTDRIGEVASFFGGHARRDRVTGGDRCVRLPGQDLAEPPLIVQLPGEFDRLGEVHPCQLGVVGGGKAAGGQRPGQHGRVIDVARERQGLLRPIHAVGSAEE